MEFATGTVTGGNISWGMSNIESIAQFGYVGQQAGQAGFTFSGSGATVDMYQNGSSTGSANIALGFTMTTSDVGVIAYDADNKEMWMGFWDAGSSSQITWINGDFSATTTFPSTNPTFNIADQDNPTFAIYANASPRYIEVNTGSKMVFNGAATTLNTDANGRFLSAAAIPTDFKAVNVDNLDDTASKLTAWAWIKNRDATDNHMLFDRIRGVGNDMHSNDTAAEVFNANTLQRFLQRGVQIGDDAEVNTNNEAYVLWQWLVGDSATTGSTNEDGSLDSTVITADADHFSVISYIGNATSGATIGHGMSSAPELIIVKEQNNANGWVVGNGRVGYGNILRLDTTDGTTADSGAFNSTAPNATVITLGSNNGTNRDGQVSGDKMLCYAFRSVPGVCKVGSYRGNGDNNGAYISVGFLPRYILVKGLSANRNWNALDTARNPVNIASPFVLLPNTTAVDTAGQVGAFDILSDGFKPRDTAANTNADGETYIYIAMADIGGNGTLAPTYGR
jgi:hypothetical protein